MKGLKMKNLFIVMLAMVMFVGCSGISFKADSNQTIMITTASRALGYKLTEADPNFAEPAKAFCTSIIAGNLDQAIFDAAQTYLIEKTKMDPLMTASVMDLVKMVQINQGTYDPVLVKIAATAMLDGITLYQTTNKSPH